MAELHSRRKRRHVERRSRARKVFFLSTGVLSLLLVAASGFSIASIRYAETKVERIPTGSSCGTEGCLKHVTPCTRKACTFLILGSDSRAGFASGSEFGTSDSVTGQRADTIIVVHVDPAANRTVVLHIPRDLRVEIPGHGTDKVNQAFDYGPDVMVQTVEDLTGLQVNHYVEVNFQGFQRLVDALGGVPICVDQPMTDTLAGLKLPHAGCYNLHGAQALAFVRARHIEGDTIPDFSRISRQQLFIRAVIQKVLSAGVVFKLPGLIRAASGNLVRDDHLSLYQLQDLTRKLASVGQQGVEFRVVPSIPTQIDGIDYVEAVQPKARLLFDRIRTGKPLGSYGKEEVSTPISPANIRVRVYDADSADKVQQVAAYLQKAGFDVLPVEQAPADLTSSAILYGLGFGKQEAVLASYLPTIHVLYDTQHTSGADVTVVVGSDFTGIEG